MESKIYISKLSRFIEGYNCATFMLVPGEKYIVERPSHNLLSYNWLTIRSVKNSNEVGYIIKLDIDVYFEPLENARENKLNLLFDGI